MDYCFEKSISPKDNNIIFLNRVEQLQGYRKGDYKIVLYGHYHDNAIYDTDEFKQLNWSNDEGEI